MLWPDAISMAMTQRVLWRRLLIACGLLLLIQVAQAGAVIQGVPLMRHFSVGELPAAPFYSDIAVDAQGTLYAGSSEGVMVYRSGLWELFELPRRVPVYTLLTAFDGRLHVGGNGLFGELRREPDGSLSFVDLWSKFTDDDGAALPPIDVYGLVETARGLVFKSGNTLYWLRRDGSTMRQLLPDGTGSRLYVADGELYVRIEDSGIYRIEEAGPVLLPGTDALNGLLLSGLWSWQGGLLYATKLGFHFGDRTGVRKLAGDADTAFAQHAPYSSTRLPDGGFAFGGYDGTVVHFSADLRLRDSFQPARGIVNGLALDRDDGLWATSESGLTRMRLPSPWAVYDQRHGLMNRLYDSAWYEGSLWVAALGLWRAAPNATGGLTRFQPVPWSNTLLETFVLQPTDAGLLIADRSGVMVLEPGAAQPRQLIGPRAEDSTQHLLLSAFDATRVLAVGRHALSWLVQRDGHWQLAARWPSRVGVVSGIAQTAPGEVWVGDRRGGAHRWRFDPQSGQLHDRSHFYAAHGLPSDSELGTHLLRLDDTLYAISGTDVRKRVGERFEPASLPMLHGLERPWELNVATTALGSFVWTSRQVWWRRHGQDVFVPQPISSSRVPGFSQVRLHDDGRLRLIAWDKLLQFDPTIDQVELAPIRARLDKVELRLPDQPRTRLPVHSESLQVLPPGSGVAFRFGLEAMEPDAEFRYRLTGQSVTWSEWTAGRDLIYRRLSPGDYRLELQARIHGGVQVEPLAYALRVEPFWYERGVVRVLFWAACALLVVLALHLRHHRVNARNRELEQRIAERTAELEAANLKLTELAVVDGLTGIANRHAMERALLRGWQRCGEQRKPLAVVMVDVDHFKQFNDRYGHQVGDMQLRRMATLLAAEVSGVDEIAARYGGEEFVLILPGVEGESARLRAERVRERVEQTMGAAGMPASISLGVAAMVPGPDGDPALLMRLADEALYRAKHGGRNRVEFARG